MLHHVFLLHKSSSDVLRSLHPLTPHFVLSRSFIYTRWLTLNCFEEFPVFSSLPALLVSVDLVSDQSVGRAAATAQFGAHIVCGATELVKR